MPDAGRLLFNAGAVGLAVAGRTGDLRGDGDLASSLMAGLVRAFAFGRSANFPDAGRSENFCTGLPSPPVAGPVRVSGSCRSANLPAPGLRAPGLPVAGRLAYFLVRRASSAESIRGPSDFTRPPACGRLAPEADRSECFFAGRDANLASSAAADLCPGSDLKRSENFGLAGRLVNFDAGRSLPLSSWLGLEPRSDLGEDLPTAGVRENLLAAGLPTPRSGALSGPGWAADFGRRAGFAWACRSLLTDFELRFVGAFGI